jgi:hypothetical protein
VLYATRNVHIAFAVAQGARSIYGCGQARRTKSINGFAWYFYRITCQQRSHSGHIAVVFASLIGATEQNVFNALRI